MNCPNCSAIVPEGASFCPQCGAPQKKTCPSCGAEVTGGGRFCNKCGAKLVPDATEPPTQNTPSAPPPFPGRLFKVIREQQVICMANTYQVTINGNQLGNIGIGQTISFNAITEYITVDIICTTIMINARLRMKLKLGINPYIRFKVEWPGKIIASVFDAEIIEQTNQF